MGKDEEEQSSRGFKVADRRRFVDDAAPEADAMGEDASTKEPAGAEPSAEAAAAAAADEAGMPPMHEINFSTFVMGLSTQALMHLGEIPDLEGGQPRLDLAAARHIIDLIAVLERKTQGNLDADEAALLERILYDLRMRFVAISRG